MDWLKKTISRVYDLKKSLLFRRKISKLRKSAGIRAGSVPATEIARHRDFWKKHAGITVPADWYRVYRSISGISDPAFVPEPVYYTLLEPALNDKAFSKAFTNKIFYHRLLGGFKFPAMLAANIDGIYYAGEELTPAKWEDVEQILEGENTFIERPGADSGGGSGVRLWRREGAGFVSSAGDLFSRENMERLYLKNWLVQPLINQHAFFAGYNESSLNTVRILTYRSPADEGIRILHSLLRVGREGMVVDNQASGGFACGMTGKVELTGFAVGKNGKRYHELNGKKLVGGTKLPHYDEICSAARELAARFLYSRLLGIDLCVDNQGKVIVIEVNDINNEINFYQMTNGALFGEYTAEVAQYCINKKRSFLIDFDI